MLVKFFPHGNTNQNPQGGRSGGGNDVKNYLLGKDNDRVNATLVRGNADQTTEIINGITNKSKYTSGVLSFAKDEIVSDIEKQDIMQDFENTLFPNMTPDQYSGYWVEHTDKDRLELHFVFANIELQTGKALPVYYARNDQYLIDSWKELTNSQYDGLISPNDPSRKRDLANTQEFEKGNPSTDDLQKQLIHDRLLDEIERNPNIKTRDDIVKTLQGMGHEVTRQGKTENKKSELDKSQDFISIKNPNGGRNLKFKGAVYAPDFDRNKSLQQAQAEINAKHAQQIAEQKEKYLYSLGKRAERLNARFGKLDRTPLANELTKDLGQIRADNEPVFIAEIEAQSIPAEITSPSVTPEPIVPPPVIEPPTITHEPRQTVSAPITLAKPESLVQPQMAMPSLNTGYSVNLTLPVSAPKAVQVAPQVVEPEPIAPIVEPIKAPKPAMPDLALFFEYNDPIPAPQPQATIVTPEPIPQPQDTPKPIQPIPATIAPTVTQNPVSEPPVAPIIAEIPPEPIAPIVEPVKAPEPAKPEPKLAPNIAEKPKPISKPLATPPVKTRAEQLAEAQAVVAKFDKLVSDTAGTLRTEIIKRRTETFNKASEDLNKHINGKWLATKKWETKKSELEGIKNKAELALAGATGSTPYHVTGYKSVKYIDYQSEAKKIVEDKNKEMTATTQQAQAVIDRINAEIAKQHQGGQTTEPTVSIGKQSTNINR